MGLADMLGRPFPFLDFRIVVFGRKERINIAAAMNDADYIEMAARPVLVVITDHNDIAAERDAAPVTSEFRAGAAHHSGQLGKVLAIIGQFVDEGVGNAGKAAFTLDIGSDFVKVAAGGCPEYKARHLRRGGGIGPLAPLLAHILAHLVGGIAATFHLGGIQLGP